LPVYLRCFENRINGSGDLDKLVLRSQAIKK
jgi:hypothetical protein